MLFTIEKIDISSAKIFTFDVELQGRSFIYIKNKHEPKIDPCITSDLISSQWGFDHYVRLFDVFYPKNFGKMIVSYWKALLSSIFITNLHAKHYQKLLTHPKLRSPFLDFLMLHFLKPPPRNVSIKLKTWNSKRR